MKRGFFLLLGMVLFPALAQALEYPLSDAGEYTLPSGSKVMCVTSESREGNAAWCTMRLAGGDTVEAFPDTVTRLGKKFTVLAEGEAFGRQPASLAWTDCKGHCINGK